MHPLDDGNGRITRLLTDLAPAQAEQQSVRFYVMSVGIMLDGDFADGINTSQYHKVTKVSKPTATRHLAALVAEK